MYDCASTIYARTFNIFCVSSHQIWAKIDLKEAHLGQILNCLRGIFEDFTKFIVERGNFSIKFKFYQNSAECYICLISDKSAY